MIESVQQNGFAFTTPPVITQNIAIQGAPAVEERTQRCTCAWCCELRTPPHPCAAANYKALPYKFPWHDPVKRQLCCSPGPAFASVSDVVCYSHRSIPAEAHGFHSYTGQQFIGVDGRPLQLRGINWFGFEVFVLL